MTDLEEKTRFDKIADELDAIDVPAKEVIVHMLMELPFIADREERRKWIGGVEELLEDERREGRLVPPGSGNRLSPEDETSLDQLCTHYKQAVGPNSHSPRERHYA